MKLSELIAKLEHAKATVGDVETKVSWFGEGVAEEDICVVYDPEIKILYIQEQPGVREEITL